MLEEVSPRESFYFSFGYGLGWHVSYELPGYNYDYLFASHPFKLGQFRIDTPAIYIFRKVFTFAEEQNGYFTVSQAGISSQRLKSFPNLFKKPVKKKS